MPVKSVHLSIPDDPPYDQESWFQSFVGNAILPLTERGILKRFYFTRYGALGVGKQIKFRYELDDPESLRADLELVGAGVALMPSDGYTDYDVTGDIGEGAKSRFMGVNNRNPTHVDRGDLAFTFLHAAAKLFLHCLTGPDQDGRWQLEPETTSRYNVESSMEQYHHLFCNMTVVPTFVAVANHPDHPSDHIMSLIDLWQLRNDDSRWSERLRVQVSF